MIPTRAWRLPADLRIPPLQLSITVLLSLPLLQPLQLLPAAAPCWCWCRHAGAAAAGRCSYRLGRSCTCCHCCGRCTCGCGCCCCCRAAPCLRSIILIRRRSSIAARGAACTPVFAAAAGRLCILILIIVRVCGRQTSRQAGRQAGQAPSAAIPDGWLSAPSACSTLPASAQTATPTKPAAGAPETG